MSRIVATATVTDATGATVGHVEVRNEPQHLVAVSYAVRPDEVPPGFHPLHAHREFRGGSRFTSDGRDGYTAAEAWILERAA